MSCSACNKTIREERNSDSISSAVCSSCPSKYHLSCLNLPKEELKLARSGGLNKYRCPVCKTKTKERFSDSTPVRAACHSNESVANIIYEAETSHEITVTPTQSVPPNTLQTFTQCLQQLQDAFEAMKHEMRCFTSSLSSTSEDMEQFRKDILEIKKELKDLDRFKLEVNNLRAEVQELRGELESRQQRNFLKDVEITGVTEQQGENLAQIVTTLSVKLGISLDNRDIDDIKRVGTRNKDSGLDKPRPIIVTLTRRAPRDQLLRAARVRRGITTNMIDVSGNPRRVYINEHLTKANRVLFSRARSIGSQLKFKFVWTSNGTIFMRRSETSSVLRVTSELILDNLTKQIPDTNPSLGNTSPTSQLS